MNRIDRITNDRRGDITEHLVRDTDPSRTVCGLALDPMLTQPACGNKRCKRCLALARVTLLQRAALATLAGSK